VRRSLERFAKREGLACGIRHRGALAGVIGLRDLDLVNRKSGMGYWIGKVHEGKGLGTSCCATLLEHAFKELHLHRLEVQCGTCNPRSVAIPERLGFWKEGLSRQVEWLYSHYVDHVLCALLEEWKGRPLPRS
jgi:ribosomal-protein-serine acetyltransferase